MATRWLGALGAEIIKIEWPENERGRLPSSTTPQDVEVNFNTSGNFNDTNVNKRSLSLNVRSVKGLEVVKRLIAISDIVIENFSSRVLRRWGLGYEELCKIKPDIVYVSMSGYGHTGRNHHYTSFGPVAQAASGLTYLSGLPDKPPAGWGWSYMEAWSMTSGKYELTERCQAAGVRALPVQSAEDRIEHDPQLHHRQMYLEMEHPALGVRKIQNAPFKISETPAINHLHSPLIGQHTREIVEGLLGCSHEELLAGYTDGTFWPTTRERYAYMEEMLR